MAAGPGVRFERRGGLGVAVLDRPRAVNALTGPMVAALSARLAEWADDDGVRQVLLRGAGDRGLCAGGDIVAIHADLDPGDPARGRRTRRFFRAEYALNSLIAAYPKPYVALMDGLVLGGGVGVSAHGSHRVVTERTRLGMPETAIGFLPDVGGTHLLSRGPGLAGTHLALTSGHAGAGDALHLGLADAFVPSGDLGALAAELETADADDALRRFARPAPPSPLAAQAAWVDAAYAARDVEGIVAALEAAGPEAARAAAAIRSNSPTAVKVTLEALRRAAADPGVDRSLAREFRAGCRLLAGADFREGIRAMVVDKDRAPRWAPPRLEDVAAADVAGYFAPLAPDDELDLPEHHHQEAAP